MRRERVQAAILEAVQPERLAGPQLTLAGDAHVARQVALGDGVELRRVVHVVLLVLVLLVALVAAHEAALVVSHRGGDDGVRVRRAEVVHAVLGVHHRCQA